MRTALSPSLNAAILQLAPRHRVSDHAPETFGDMLQAPGVIWAGDSKRTIYADPAVNWAFRAWHDAVHAALNFDFTLAGEAATCEAQIRQLYSRWPTAPLLWARILRAEIVAQGEHLAATGKFPADQYAFTVNALACDNLSHIRP